MCASMRQNLGLSSSLKMKEEEEMVTKKQGIVSILGTDSDKSSDKLASNSLRRTLSADMSSKKWLSENGFFSPMKKVASSEEFSVSNSISEMNSSSSSEDGEGENELRSRFDVWNSIQEEKNNNKELEKHGPFDLWSSILSQKAHEDSMNKPLPPPYVHPLVKRSTSSLSGKSLEICTESLGSETGSDGFSSYPSSEIGDVEEDKEDNVQGRQEPQKQEEIAHLQEEPRTVKYNNLGGKKLSQPSFPPPIRTLSHQDGASTYMKTCRDNGRLVLEFVAVPSKKIFCAQRQHGRLVLTFANTNDVDEEEQKNEEISNGREEERKLEDLEEQFESSEEERASEKEEEETQEEEEAKKEMGGFEMEQAPKFSSGLIRFHRLALMVNKPMGIANRNPTCTGQLNEVVKLKGEEEEEEVEVEKSKPPTSLAQSLPPRPPVARLIPSKPPSAAATMSTAAAAASFNGYEEYWRPKRSSVLNPSSKSNSTSSINKVILTKNLMADHEQQQQWMVLRKKDNDELVSLLQKGCKEQRRSLLFLEPYCIATS